MLAIEKGSPPEQVNGPVLGGGHQPGAWVLRNSGFRPLLQRDHESFLRQVFCDTHIAHHAGQAGDQLRRLDSPDRINGAMGIGGGHAIDLIIFDAVSASESAARVSVAIAQKRSVFLRL